MNGRNGKRVLIAAISASGLLAVAGIIILIVAITQGWDIIGGLTSPMAFLIYALIAIALLGVGGLVVRYFTTWRYR